MENLDQIAKLWLMMEVKIVFSQDKIQLIEMNQLKKMK